MNHRHPIATRAARLAVMSLLSLAVTACATTDGARSEAVQDELRPAQIDISSLHPMARAVAQAGAPECAMKVHEAAFYLVVDADSGAIADVRSEDLFSFSLEVIDPEGMTSYVSLNVAPGKDNACAISYEIVTPIAMKCEDIAQEIWPDATAGNPLRRQIIPLGLEDGTIVLLHPVGESACIVIRKEIFP
jgi:hypothetical protein